MTRFTKFAGSVAIVAAMLAPVAASADDKDVIDYRQHLMNTLDAQSQIVGQILSGVTPDKHGTGALEIIALTAKLSKGAFEPKAEGGQSKPEVWTKHDDFSKKMASFVENSAHVAEMAKKSSFQETISIMIDALPCKGCHDPYRDSSKK